ncbi:RHS repeat protein [Marinobacter halodurans]|uniref:RHS repeat protein n=1 Tax=Marinobacter halodurans TaxID=2528979 RepID=A0ABY1ZE33_9GAMM|nr:RHS repeat protein [Marinobacter halodurans]
MLPKRHRLGFSYVTQALLATTLFALTHCVSARVNELPPKYGSPYSVPTGYPYSVSGMPSITAAINTWWSKYQDYWNASSCSFRAVYVGENSPERAKIKLQNGCSGGGYVKGTPRCPTGYELSGSRCLLAAPNTPSPEKQRGASCSSPKGTRSLVGNPINAATGNKFQSETDISLHGSSLLHLTRNYNSSDSRIGDFGVGWQLDGLSRLRKFELTSGNVIRLEEGDGRVLYFSDNSGQWVPDEDISLSLSDKADGSGYLLQSRQGLQREFDSSGLLTQVATRDGRVLHFSYNTNDQVSQISDQARHTITLTRNNRSLVVEVSLVGGSEWQYSYDDLNRLVSVTQPDGTQVRYQYGNESFPYALTGIVDQNGDQRGAYTYDDQGRGIQTSAEGGVNQIALEYLSYRQIWCMNIRQRSCLIVAQPLLRPGTRRC